jgi:uncharacterized SAM-dependent methyltransferase
MLESNMKSERYLVRDLSKPILEESLTHLAHRYRFVQCSGLWGTFVDAFTWAHSISSDAQPKFFLSLGSIYGNDRFDSAVEQFSR